MGHGPGIVLWVVLTTTTVLTVHIVICRAYDLGCAYGPCVLVVLTTMTVLTVHIVIGCAYDLGCAYDR